MHVWTVVWGNTASIASGNPLRPSTQQMRMSWDPALLEVVEDLHPELGALVGLKPHPENLTITVHRDRHREVARFALNTPAVADLQHQSVQEDDWIDVLERPGLPGPSVVHDRVGHLADQVTADLDAVDLLQVRLDIPCRQTPAIEREDLVVDPLETPLTLPTICGSNVPARSRGVSICTSPCSVISVFDIDPFLALPVPPGGS